MKIAKNSVMWFLVLVLPCIATGQDQATVLQQFRDHIAAQDYSEEVWSRAVVELDAFVEAPTADAVSTVLSILNDDFSSAYEASMNGETDDAIEKLTPLSKSDDKYVKTEAEFLLAKCLLDKGDHESALPLLESSSLSMRASERLFLRGICQANLLKREDAIESFAEFMRSYPDASERQRINAWRQLEILSLVEEGTLVDAYQKMEYARRRLALARANEPTQQTQKQTIVILDKLIEEAEEREAISESESKKESQGKKQSKSGGKGKGKEGPGEGVDDKTPMKTVRQIQQGSEATPWDHVRDRKRDAKALAAIKEKYPARYRALIEQYYRSLQEESER